MRDTIARQFDVDARSIKYDMEPGSGSYRLGTITFAAKKGKSIDLHKRSDVPIGGYISGGLDSSIVASLATRGGADSFEGFTGKFTVSSKYDESPYARAVA